MILFFDGCHKIYYASENERDTIGQMVSYGYDPIRGATAMDMQSLWEISCPLRFISPADLADDAPHVYQGEESENVEEFANDVIVYLYENRG